MSVGPPCQNRSQTDSLAGRNQSTFGICVPRSAGGHSGNKGRFGCPVLHRNHENGLADVDNHTGDIVFGSTVQRGLNHRFRTLLRIVISCQNSLNGRVINAVGDAI